MEKFLKALKEEGYTENTLRTYERVLKYFHKFLDFYNYDFKNFDEEKLYSFISVRYRTEKSFRTAMSAIQHYLKFNKVKRRLKFTPPETGEFKEFRPIKKEELKKLEELISTLRSKDLQTAMLMVIHLGLAPAEIGKLKVNSYGIFLNVPVIQEGKIKRFVLNDEINERLKEIKEEKLPIAKLINSSSATMKVTFHNLMKKSNLDLTVADFKDNYVAKLIELGFPLDIVVEYSGRNLERVSYINRYVTLKSKADVIESVLKKKLR